MNSIEAELVVKGLSDLGSVTARTAAPWRNFSVLHALMTLPQANILPRLVEHPLPIRPLICIDLLCF